MKMKADTTHYGWSSTVDTHLMKNSEWGAVAYLCYSAFGSVPEVNGNAKTGTNRYDFHTGAGPKATDDEGRYENWSADTNGYNTALGQLASTTGNVYGIYDMSGGAWERVAAYYDNGHKYLNTTGKSEEHDGSETEYFNNLNELNEIYKDYWEAYEVSTEEKGNSITVEGEQLTQDVLWSSSKKDEEGEDKYEKKRHDLTEKTWNKLEKVKGIGMNEVGGSWSYQGLVGTGIGWKVNTGDTKATYGKAWNSDYVMIGSANTPFLHRGGCCTSGAGAGVLFSSADGGHAYNSNGFRPALILN